MRAPTTARSTPRPASVPPARGSHITIEQTGKRWKALYLLAAAVIALGILLVFAGYPLIGLPIVILGCGVRIFQRAGAWWHHG